MDDEKVRELLDDAASFARAGDFTAAVRYARDAERAAAAPSVSDEARGAAAIEHARYVQLFHRWREEAVARGERHRANELANAWLNFPE